MIDELKVISRTSSSSYRERKEKRIPEIADELNVAYIVEGSVQKYDDKARITIQLIDAKNDKHVWVNSYDKDIADVFKTQSEIALKVASELTAVLTNEQAAELQKNPTENIKAFELYQLGRFYSGKRAFDGVQKSIGYFEKAIAEDPGYALAYAGIADSYYLTILYDAKNKEYNRSKALEFANKALEIDNQLAEAYTVLATIYSFVDWNWEAAEKAFLKGIEYNPNFSNIHHRYSEHLSMTGRIEMARKHINRALELDPLSFIIRAVSAQDYYDRGLFKEAQTEFIICSDIFMNRFHWLIHDAEFQLNYRFENAQKLIDNLKVVEDKYGVMSSSGKIDSIHNAYGLKGLARYRAEIEPDPFYKATFYGLCGDDEKAMGFLEISFDREVYFPAYTSYMYEFKNLHSNPRFIALMKKINLPWSPDDE